jgi:hypothetical protein
MLAAGCKVTMMHQLCLEAMEETFSNGIIPTISFATHALCDAIKL